MANSKKKTKSIVQLLLVIGILIFINILASAFYGKVDLTEDKRFTLTPATQDLLGELDEVVFVKVLLDGEFPAGFKRLQTSIREILDDFRSETGYIEYEFENPGLGTVDEINARRTQLAEYGINPMNLRLASSNETSEQLIYPYAILYYKNREYVVNLLENEVPGMPDEVILNNSVALLEYKLANGIQKLKNNRKPAVLFTTGHGELEPIQTRDFETTLRQFYNTGRINLDSIVLIDPKVDVLVVARPRGRFSEQHKFKIDQYVMNGGKVIWLIDRLNVHLDSLRKTANYMPIDYPLEIEDLLYKYGVRIQPNLVLDLQCSRIPLGIGKVGNAKQLDLFPWYYHVVSTPKSNHPVSKNLDRINLMFPGSIDTIKTKTTIKKSILLESSQYSRMQFSPVRLNFEILRYKPDPTKFNKGPQPLAVMLEGTFPSLYENRVTEEMKAGLAQINVEVKGKSVDTKMLVVADGDIVKNPVDPTQDAIRPLGFNKYENYQFANKDFLVNAVEYMMDKNGVIEARSKEVKLRMLDTVKATKEKGMWQAVNIGLPLLFLLVFGLLFNFVRKRRYAS